MRVTDWLALRWLSVKDKFFETHAIELEFPVDTSGGDSGLEEFHEWMITVIIISAISRGFVAVSLAREALISLPRGYVKRWVAEDTKVNTTNH